MAPSTTPIRFVPPSTALCGRRSGCAALAVFRVCLLSLAVVLAARPSPVAAETRVSLELILAIDVSGSVDGFEWADQIEGIVAAFRDPEVVKSIEQSPGGIAVKAVAWAGPSSGRVMVPWRHLTDDASATAFALAIGRSVRRISGNTAIGDMLRRVAPMFDGNGFVGDRRVIDVSGDGVGNEGADVAAARDAVVATGITVNGLAIGGSDPEVFAYYRSQVIGGPGAFLVSARGFFEFAAAIRRKLLREIRGPMFAAEPPPAAG